MGIVLNSFARKWLLGEPCAYLARPQSRVNFWLRIFSCPIFVEFPIPLVCILIWVCASVHLLIRINMYIYIYVYIYVYIYIQYYVFVSSSLHLFTHCISMPVFDRAAWTTGSTLDLKFARSLREACVRAFGLNMSLFGRFGI